MYASRVDSCNTHLQLHCHTKPVTISSDYIDAMFFSKGACENPKPLSRVPRTLILQMPEPQALQAGPEPRGAARNNGIAARNNNHKNNNIITIRRRVSNNNNNSSSYNTNKKNNNIIKSISDENSNFFLVVIITNYK